LSDTVQKAALEAHNFLWEAPWQDSQLCSQSNSSTWATNCTLGRTWSCLSSPEQLPL
jgi:hypothetical protein